MAERGNDKRLIISQELKGVIRLSDGNERRGARNKTGGIPGESRRAQKGSALSGTGDSLFTFYGYDNGVSWRTPSLRAESRDPRAFFEPALSRGVVVDASWRRNPGPSRSAGNWVMND